MRMNIDRNHPEPVNNKKDERLKRQTAQPAKHAGLPITRKLSGKLQSPATNGTGSPERKDWTPDVRRLDPRGTRPQDPASQTRTKDFAEARTSWDSGLCGIQDYAGTGTSWESGLRGTQDFVGPRTQQEIGTLHARTRILFGGVLSENTNFRIKLKAWIPLGIRLVVSVKYCVLFFMAFRCTDTAHGTL